MPLRPTHGEEELLADIVVREASGDEVQYHFSLPAAWWLAEGLGVGPVLALLRFSSKRRQHL